MYQFPDKKLWTGRTDADGAASLRWHQSVEYVDCSKGLNPVKNTQSFVLFGYASDLGVALNQGRIGAYKGPDIIRSTVANLPQVRNKKLFDAGNAAITSNQTVEELQEETGGLAGKLVEAGYKLILLGGGHDITYASYLALYGDIEASHNFGFINFDAHFDLRSGISRNSGTSYFHIQESLAKRGIPFQYFAFGIQREANTQALFDRASKFEVSYVVDPEVHQYPNETAEKFDFFISSKDKIHLSIDLDVLNVAFAPGVSAVNPQGLTPWQLQYYLSRVLASGKVVSIDIAEYNPDFDRDLQTGRLAARLIQQLITEWI